MNADSQPLQTRSSACVPQTGEVKSPAVLLWQTLLRAIAVLNLVLLSVTTFAVMSQQAATRAPADATFYLQLLLSALYTLGCAYRCLLPVYDIPRLVMVNSRLSSVLVGRSVATLAEVSFAAQWALILHQMAVLTHNSLGEVVSLALVPLIVLAQCCCWYAVLTTAQRGHIFENSIWGVSAAFVALSILLMLGPHQFSQLHSQVITWGVGAATYAVFMLLFDVPMYWSRWRADQANGRQYLTLTQGAADVGRRWTVSYRWEDWKSEVLWMSLYFTVGVWVSISLIHASVALEGH
jgi:hypothetical protein